MENRFKLHQATRELYAEGAKLTISAAAERAGISVATAYRYYSDPEDLRRSATLDRAFSPENTNAVENYRQSIQGVADPLERLLEAQRQMLNFVMRTELEYRMFVATSHEVIVRSGLTDKKIPAGGRRILLIEEAIDPLREELSEDEFSTLVYQLMMVTAHDPYFILSDFADLDVDEITSQNFTAIRAIYTQFMANRAS